MLLPCSVCLILNSLLTTLLVYCLPFSGAGNNDTDRLALYDIKSRITGDPLGTLTSWNESLHFCQWHGVYCGRRHQRVTALRLNSSKLTGTLSPFVGNLSFLRVLNLYHNSFTGSIRPEIGRLHRLQVLYLLNNSFSGEIPSNLSRCSSLISLRLDNNNLVGEIPPSFGSFPNLQTLALFMNKLSGPIPSSLGNLTSLSAISLGRNNLIGTIPDSLVRLQKLTYLSLFENSLSGTVPPSIFNLSLLTVLDLGTNHNLIGKLPSNLGTMLPNLQVFSIVYNQFIGSIPASISNCSNLDTLELGSNYLQGEVPCLRNLQRLGWFSVYNNSLGLGKSTDLDFVSCLANATMLEQLLMHENNFGGNVPRVVCNFTFLSLLDIGANKIGGQIPSCIHHLVKLQGLDLSDNNLSGVIPSRIGKLQNLVVLDLSSNQLSGIIPSSIGNLTRLTSIFLGGNNLRDPIPSSIGNFRYLLELDLSSNNFRGKIPLQLFNLSSLSIELDLSQNSFVGSLSKEVQELKNLVALDVSHNMLSGALPSTLGECIALEALYMNENHFQGAIPQTFASLKGLQELDLSNNNFSGGIPKFLVDFPMEMLNLSYNNFEGEVPIGGVFNNKKELSIVGNNGLCGGIPELKLPPCNFKQSRKGRLGHRKRLIISISSGVLGVGLLVACISMYVFRLKKRGKDFRGDSENALPLSYKDILKATNDFSSRNIIGSGTFGVVYKAILDEGRTIVAIKTFNLAHRGASKSFMAECQVLRNIRHRNLVKVISACSSIDYKGGDFKALVYEYMVNESLDDWLHKKPILTSDAPRSLNFLQRLDIAIDVALALDYLHHHCNTPIVHCDLKPSNVLLDDEMVAHVGDFGLAKFLLDDITSSQTNQSSSIGVRGTIGYTPPEYGLGNELSTSGDVYSFGVLLLEIFTGKRPTDDMFKDGTSLQSFVQLTWPERVMEIVDPILIEDIVGEETNTSTDHTHHLLKTAKSKVILEALSAVIGIALSCCAELPQDRLNMSTIAAQLSSVRTKLRGIRSL